MENYDVVVIGLGAMGSASLMQVAKAGVKVLGLEAKSLTHQYGSSYGETRLFRRAYWEGGKYLPLLERAHVLWELLEEEAGVPLIKKTGGLFTGSKNSKIVQNSEKSALKWSIEHEVMNNYEIEKQFPAYQLTSETVAIYEPGAYVIAADRARLSMVDIAVENGAQVLMGESVSEIASTDQGVIITTSAGNTLHAGSAIVTTGPWLSNYLIKDLHNLLVPSRVPIYWFSPKHNRQEDFTADNFPAFLFDHPDGHLLYSLPQIGWDKGVKIGFHNHQQIEGDPDNKDRKVSADNIEEISRFVADILPGLNSEPIDSRICFYTMSPDESFFIGRSTDSDRICFASACSGHGFKFATSIGEVLADLSLDAPLKVDISDFSTTRFN